MKFKEKESLYYSFELDISFIDSKLNYSYTKKQLILQHTHKQLNIFIDNNIIKIPYLNNNPDRVDIYSKNIKKINEVKEFCNFLIDSNCLLHIAIESIFIKFDLTNFQGELLKAYENYKMIIDLQSTDKKINKRPKI